MMKQYDSWATRESISDLFQEKYQREHAKAIKGIKISLGKMAKKVAPDKRFKFEVKFLIEMKEIVK